MCSKSSFNDEISEIPGISVDSFQVNSRAYFLSHYHADHIQGLWDWRMSDYLRATNTYIYTTEITFKIMKHINGNTVTLRYVKCLNKDYNLITLPSVPEQDLEELLVDVTLIPAGHCLGSTMFLFKTLDKTVLYTGDFRVRINDIPRYSELHKRNGDPIHIDAMYVDTTFIDPKYEDFSKRTDTVDTLIDEIESWLRQSESNAIALFIYANYTFEFITKKIHQRLNIKVYVGHRDWELYRSIPELVPGITDDKNSRIHLCSNGYKDEEKCAHDPKLDYLHIRLTAMLWYNYSLDSKPIERRSDRQIFGCFATHCSRSELISFVEYFSPTKVVGFPNAYRLSCPTTPNTPKECYVPSPKGGRSSKKREARKRPLESVGSSVNRRILL